MTELVNYLDDYVTYEQMPIEDIESEVTLTSEELSTSTAMLFKMYKANDIGVARDIANDGGVDLQHLTEESLSTFIKSASHGIITLIKRLDKLIKKWLTKFLITVGKTSSNRDEVLHWYNATKKEYGDIKSNYILKIPKVITKSFFSNGLSGKDTSALLTFMLPEKGFSIRQLVDEDKVTLATNIPDWVRNEPRVIIDTFNLGSGRISVFVDASQTLQHMQDSFVTKGIIKSSRYRLNEEITLQDLKLDIGRVIGWLTMTKSEVRGVVDSVYDKYVASVDLLRSRLAETSNEHEAMAIKKSISLAVTHYGKTIMSVRKSYSDAIDVIRFLKTYGKYNAVDAVEDIAVKASKNVDVDKEVIIPVLVDMQQYLENTSLPETLVLDINNYVKSNLGVLEDIAQIKEYFFKNLEHVELVRSIVDTMELTIKFLITLTRVTSGEFREIKLEGKDIVSFIKDHLTKELVNLDASKLASYVVLSNPKLSTITDVRTALLETTRKDLDTVLRDFVSSGGFNINTFTEIEDVYRITGYEEEVVVTDTKAPPKQILSPDEWMHMKKFLKLEGDMDLSTDNPDSMTGYKNVLGMLISGELRSKLESEKDKNVIRAMHEIVTSGLPEVTEALKEPVFDLEKLVTTILENHKNYRYMIEGFSLLRYEEVPDGYRGIVELARRKFSATDNDDTTSITYENILGATSILLQEFRTQITNNSAYTLHHTNKAKQFGMALESVFPKGSRYITREVLKVLIHWSKEFDHDPADKAIYNRFHTWKRHFYAFLTGKYSVRLSRVDLNVNPSSMEELSKLLSILLSLRLTADEIGEYFDEDGKRPYQQNKD